MYSVRLLFCGIVLLTISVSLAAMSINPVAESSPCNVTLDHFPSSSVDRQGNRYLLGKQYGPIILNNHELDYSGDGSSYLMKIGSEGQYLWNHKITGGVHEPQMWVDDQGNTVVFGPFSETIRIGEYRIIPPASEAYFFVRLDPSGRVLWSSTVEGMISIFPSGVLENSQGAICIAGYYYNQARFGGNTIRRQFQDNIFVAKLDSNGLWSWVATAGFRGLVSFMGLSSDRSGEMYMDLCSVGPGLIGESHISSDNPTVYRARIRGNGNWISTQKLMELRDERGADIPATDQEVQILRESDLSGVASGGLNLNGSHIRPQTGTNVGTDDAGIVAPVGRPIVHSDAQQGVKTSFTTQGIQAISEGRIESAPMGSQATYATIASRVNSLKGRINQTFVSENNVKSQAGSVAITLYVMSDGSVGAADVVPQSGDLTIGFLSKIQQQVLTWRFSVSEMAIYRFTMQFRRG